MRTRKLIMPPIKMQLEMMLKMVIIKRHQRRRNVDLRSAMMFK